MRRALQLFAASGSLIFAVRALAFWYRHPAEALFDGDLAAQRELARGMDRWATEDLGRDDFATGSDRFDGEWLFATRMMGVLGYGQTAIEHPELRAAHALRIDDAIDDLISVEGRAFDREAWGADPLDDLGTSRSHVGYLGYLGLALAMARTVNPETRHAPLEQRVVEHLVCRLEASEIGLLETYPGEVFPIDNTSFFGALGLHDRATGEDHSRLLERSSEALAGRYRDPHTGSRASRSRLRSA